MPKVLVQMAEYLVANGGLEREGVFRLAPDKSRERQVRAELDHGTFKSCPDDVNLIAHLIKVHSCFHAAHSTRRSTYAVPCDHLTRHPHWHRCCCVKRQCQCLVAFP